MEIVAPATFALQCCLGRIESGSPLAGSSPPRHCHFVLIGNGGDVIPSFRCTSQKDDVDGITVGTSWEQGHLQVYLEARCVCTHSRGERDAGA